MEKILGRVNPSPKPARLPKTLQVFFCSTGKQTNKTRFVRISPAQIGTISSTCPCFLCDNCMAARPYRLFLYAFRIDRVPPHALCLSLLLYRVTPRLEFNFHTFNIYTQRFTMKILHFSPCKFCVPFRRKMQKLLDNARITWYNISRECRQNYR